MAIVPLRQIAHARAGDKGDISIIGVFARTPDAYDWLVANLTVEALGEIYGALATGPITRYEAPRLGALNFVLDGALGGGVTRSTRLDRHGKSNSGLLLGAEFDVPEKVLASNRTVKGTVWSV